MPAGFGAAPGLIETFVYPASFGHPAGYGGGYGLPFPYGF